MSKFTSKAQFLDEVDKEKALLDDLLAVIDPAEKLVEVTDGMTVKDFLAHRAEWGRMMIHWLKTARIGDIPAVPSERFKWNQLKELNAEILRAYAETPLEVVEVDFAEVQERLRELIATTTSEELFTKKYYSFTGSSDLITYFNSASASHYRSARRHIQKWWRSRPTQRRSNI